MEVGSILEVMAVGRAERVETRPVMERMQGKYMEVSSAEFDGLD